MSTHVERVRLRQEAHERLAEAERNMRLMKIMKGQDSVYFRRACQLREMAQRFFNRVIEGTD